MSAEAEVHAALLAAVRAVAGLNGVYEGPAVKASPPYAEIGELLSADWSVKDRAGRELRVAIMLRDAAEGPGRLHALAGAVGDAVEAMPRVLGGWQVASLAFVRTRVLRPGAGRWSAVVEYRVRVLAAG
ncbi:DUF3168 domain-containing protein [Sphingomonas immobilis]|uniref:DUF3168 domain-containing protein n=1 Tax=Sphingomonas immobilis TaxID=3063997 RepID=A0ABT9A1R5_9SPHN|nr:DUF3168 domain-containing protein [Sphingomonas sp. CA1-15]MDO7843745.1 DUF3168 domain-containing protein [Sphingomonas sp. CA1-15]